MVNTVLLRSTELQESAKCSVRDHDLAGQDGPCAVELAALGEAAHEQQDGDKDSQLDQVAGWVLGRVFHSTSRTVCAAVTAQTVP